MNEITMYRGNDRTVQITILDKETGLAYDLTGCTVTMLVKKSIDDADENAIITKVTTDPTEGAIDTIPTTGVAEFYLVPADTTDALVLNNNVPYPVDFRVTTPTPEKLYTVLRTWLTILAR